MIESTSMSGNSSAPRRTPYAVATSPSNWLTYLLPRSFASRRLPTVMRQNLPHRRNGVVGVLVGHLRIERERYRPVRISFGNRKHAAVEPERLGIEGMQMYGAEV